MSVGVITSPLTIAVALTIEGMALPNTCAFSGSFSDWAVLTGGFCGGCGLFCPEFCAIAALAAASAAAPIVIHRRVFVTPKPAATFRFSLFPNVCHCCWPAERRLSG